MSRIFRKDNLPGVIKDYSLESFADDPSLVDEEKEKFIPDSYGSEGSAEFIPGGFDFDYKRGLRRDEIISQSLDESKKIIEKAKEEASQIIAKSEAEGFEIGRQKGYEAGLKEADPLISVFTGLIKELKNIRHEFHENSEEEVLNLVLSVARTVIGLEVERDPSLIQNVIREAVKQLETRENMKILVNPEDLAEAEEFKPQLGKDLERQVDMTIEPDSNITRGGCMVETNIGSIDARLETQLESIREKFVQTMNESKAREKSEESDGD